MAKPKGKSTAKTRKHRLPSLPPADIPTVDLGPLLEGLQEVVTVARKKRAAEEAPPPPAEWALVAYAGPALGQLFPLHPGESILGRAPQAGIGLQDDEVSRLHARITLEEGPHGTSLQVEDLGSTNGTSVNGRHLAGPTPLSAGDRLGVGRHVLKLVQMDALERAFHLTLLDQSTRDPLTGLANRASTLAELQSRFDLSARHQRPLCVVMVDLDHFKRINDTLGHGAGDEVLQGFGERVRANLRASDFAGRIGGEEFLLILSETETSGAEMLAQRLRKAAELPYELPQGPLQATCSLGLAQQGQEDADPGGLLSRADAALYQAKSRGRNRVVIAP